MPRPACPTGRRLHVTASFPGPGSYRVSPAVTCNMVLLCRALKSLWIDSAQAADSIEATATPPVARLDCPQTIPVRFSRRQAANSQTTVTGNHLNKKGKLDLSTGRWKPNHYYFLSIFSLQDKKDRNTSFCLFPEQVRLCDARAGKDPCGGIAASSSESIATSPSCRRPCVAPYSFVTPCTLSPPVHFSVTHALFRHPCALP